MPSIAEYRTMLSKAQEAGDTEAVKYFESQIGKGAKVQGGYSGRDHGALPTSGTMADSALQGLTFGFSDELAGIGGGLASEIMNQLGYEGEGFSKGYGEIRDWVRDRAKDYEERHPYLSLGAEIGSGLVFPLGAIRSGVSALRTGAKSGALYGAGKSETDEDAPIGERLQEFATDTALGAGFGAGGSAALQGLSGIGRAIFPRVSSKARAPSFQGKLETLRREGVPTNVGERIANPTVRQDAGILSRSLGQSDAIEQRGETLMSRLMGRANFAPEDIRTGDLSREAVDRAGQRFSRGYDQALRNVRVRMPDMDPYLRRIEAGYNQLMSHEQRAQITRILNDFRGQISRNRTLSGRDYKRLRSNIGKMMARAQRSDRDSFLAPVYGALQQTLDDAFRQNAPGRAVRQLRGLDRQYGAYKLLQQAVDNPEAIGTLANRAKAAGGRVDRQFRELLEAYQDVVLRGGHQTSGTPEGLATLNPLSLAMPLVRTTGAHGSELAARVLPSGIPLPQHSGGFVAGQQSDELADTVGLK